MYCASQDKKNRWLVSWMVLVYRARLRNLSGSPSAHQINCSALPDKLNHLFSKYRHLTIIRQQILDYIKMKEFTNDNFRRGKNGGKFIYTIKKTLMEKEKLLVTSNFSFSLNVFIKFYGRNSVNWYVKFQSRALRTSKVSVFLQWLLLLINTPGP